MVARVPADFVVLSHAETTLAIACIEVALKYHPDERARGLLAALRDVASPSRMPREEMPAGLASGNGTASTREVGDLLHLSPRRVLQLRDDGLLRGEKVGRDVRIDIGSVRELLETRAP